MKGNGFPYCPPGPSPDSYTKIAHSQSTNQPGLAGLVKSSKGFTGKFSQLTV